MKTENLGRINSLRLAVGAALALCAAATSAAPVISNIVGGSSFPAFNGTNQTVGWAFTVAPGAGVTVTDLGFFDSTPATDLSQTHQVGIWDLVGTLLGSATVQTNGSLVGAFRYAAATPFSLAGGGSYVIGGAITSPFTDVYVSGVTSFDIDPLFTYAGAARSDSSSGFAAPLTVTANTGGRFGPNFQFTENRGNSVPEPSTLWVVMMGLGVLGAGRLYGKATVA